MWHTIQLIIILFFSDPTNVYCLKPCEFINPETGDTKFVKIGENITLPDMSARGQYWVDKDGNTIDVIECLIQKSDNEDIPISEFQEYEISDIDECADGVVNAKTGLSYCNYAESNCMNKDLLTDGRQYECSCKSGFTVFGNSDCGYCKSY